MSFETSDAPIAGIDERVRDLEEDEDDLDLPSSFSVHRGKKWPQFLSTFAATTGAFAMGCAIGWSGPALSLLPNDSNSTVETLFELDDVLDTLLGAEFVITPADKNWIASLMPLGALFGGN